MARIAHFGAFDHDSFGDLLFPKIARRFLSDHEQTFVSPYAVATPFSDAEPTVSVAEALSRNDFDAVILGGGNLLGFMRWAPRPWREREAIPGTASLNMWLSSICLADRLDVPMLFNATGSHGFDVPKSIEGDIRKLLFRVSYASVRDSPTVEMISPYLKSSPVVSPDSALLVSRVWPVEGPADARVVTCIVRNELLGVPDEIAAALKRLKDRGLSIEHLSMINHLWQYEPDGLEKALARVGLEASPIECSLEAWSRRIGGSEGYIGNSLHGLIVAVSYGRRAVLVMAKDRKDMTKYRGFLEACGLPPEQFLAYGWDEAVEKYCRQTAKVSDRAFDAVLENFKRMEQAIEAGPVGERTGIELNDVLEKFASGFRQRARVLYKWSLQANGKNHPLTRKYRFASRPLTSWIYRLLGGGL